MRAHGPAPVPGIITGSKGDPWDPLGVGLEQVREDAQERIRNRFLRSAPQEQGRKVHISPCSYLENAGPFRLIKGIAIVCLFRFCSTSL